MIIILAELNGSNPKVDLGVGNARSKVIRGSGGGRSAKNALLFKKKGVKRYFGIYTITR